MRLKTVFALFLSTACLVSGCGTLQIGIERSPPVRDEPSSTADSRAGGRVPLKTAASAAATVAPTSGPARLPDRCHVQGYSVYIDTDGRYCFAYPLHFRLSEFSPGQPGIFGPALDESVEPIAANLAISIGPVATGSDLGEIVDAFVAEYANLPLPPIDREPFELGGEPAEVLEVVPGHTGSRDVLAIHDGDLYRLIFMPSTRDFPQAAPDVEALFEAVTTSFSFLR